MQSAGELRSRFIDLLARHGVTLTRNKGTVLCLFHSERTPSLSINIERGLFHCFGCGVGGGVKKFAELLGEEWSSTPSASPMVKARRSRFQAEQNARAILKRQRDERANALFAALCPLWREAADAAWLLSLFRRRPDLADEFSTPAAATERQYSDLILKLSVLEAQLDEVAA